MMRLKQVHFGGKKIQTKWKLLVLHEQPIIHFDLRVARNEDPKNLLLRKGEMCNIVVVNPVLQNERKNILSVSVRKL